MENHLSVRLGGKSCFSHTNPSNFGRPLRSLLLRYTAVHFNKEEKYDITLPW